LALKISYINAVSAICEASGADVEKVADGIGMDHRIGRDFLNAGIGYGGSCFPKDIAAFITIAERLGVPFNLLKEVQRINNDQKGIQKARAIKAVADAEFASSALEAVNDAEALVIATEWNEFANVDLAVLKEKMRTPIVFDGRNLLDPGTMGRLGFHYYSIGRASVKPR